MVVKLLKFMFLFSLLGLLVGCGVSNKDSGVDLNQPNSSWSVNEYRGGLIPDDPSLRQIVGEYKFSGVSIKSESLPVSVDISSLMPPILSQGSQNSCVGWAAGYYLKTYQEAQEEGWDTSNSAYQFSPSWIYNQINGGGDNGSRMSDALYLLTEKGCDTKDNFAYNESVCVAQPDSASLTRGAQYRSYGWQYLSGDLSEIKSLLARGYVIPCAILYYVDLYNLSGANPIYDEISGGHAGYHAVSLVGYDDDLNAFKFINSWGTGWGHSGYGWVDYDILDDLKFVAYILYDKDNVYESGSSIVSIVDPILDESIREQINKPTGNLVVSDVSSIVTLNIKGTSTRKVRSLSGIENLSSLSSLSLVNHAVEDLRYLEGLSSLNYLNVNYNNIDISPGSYSKYVIDILVSANCVVEYDKGNTITNPYQVIDLNNQYLELIVREKIFKPYGDILSDDLKQITDMELNSLSISDISWMQYCTGLVTVNLSNNSISDLSPLQSLDNLEYVNLNFNSITDISALAGLTEMKQLALWSNSISTVNALSALTEITHLDLNSNSISDITPIGTLVNAVFLDVESNGMNITAGSDNLNIINEFIGRGCNTLYSTGNTL